MALPRVASLIASSTEIVCALGFADLLVARSHECDYPEFVRELPQITKPKMQTDISSLEIDREVRAIVGAGLSVYQVDADRLKEIDPNIIITQDHCEVCAVSTKDLEAAVCDWMGENVNVISLKPDTLWNIFDDIIRVATALGDRKRGERLVASLQARLDAVRDRAASIEGQPRVAFIEWIDPLMAGGNWVPELIEMLDAVDVLGTAGEHSGWISFEDLEAADPDVIVIAPCGFDLERTKAEMSPLSGHARWQDMRAVRDGRVYVADGNAYFNRPGPRLVESFEILAETIYSGEFDFGHENVAWEKLNG
jgi:iron complex transport system substrate-binding protein